MKCPALAAAVACACLQFAPAAPAAGDTAYFVELAGGKATVDASVFDDDATQWSARAGHRWGLFGVEAGYADLGGFNNPTTLLGTPLDMRFNLSGWFLGANLRVPVAERSHFTARAGVFGWKSNGSAVPAGASTPVLARLPDESGNDWYAGVGLSFDVGERTSVGVNLDRYHARSALADFQINTYSVNLEQRF